MGNAFCQHCTEATAEFIFFFSTWVELIGGGLVASRSLIDLLIGAAKRFTSRVLKSGVSLYLWAPGLLPVRAVVCNDQGDADATMGA